ncbi:MAG: YbfB/YjiJ family MFS transporter [Burkholderiaceae bacterium]|nr:YbfB/YjiJ family MFS transporter [Burkholderiaceae bacterium]
MSSSLSLKPWQVWLGGMASLVLTLAMARLAYTPMLPVMQSEAGLSVAGGGWLASVNYLGYMSGALLVAYIDSPLLRHKLYRLGLWLGVLGTVGMAWSAHMGWWVLVRYVGGLSGAAGMLLGTGLILSWMTRAGKRAELGAHFMGIGIGIVISAAAAAAFAGWGLSWQLRWWGFGLIALLCAVVAWRWCPPAPPALPSHASAVADPPQPWLWPMVLAYFCAGVGFVISATFTVVVIEAVPALAGKGSLAWLLVGVAAIPTVYLWDKVARALGELKALALAYAVQTLSVALPALSDSLWAGLSGAALYGATFLGIVSMTLSFAGRRAPNNPGKAMAKLTLGYGVAQILAPVMAAYAAAVVGNYLGALWMTAAMLLVGAALLMWLHNSGRAQTRPTTAA